MEYVSCARNCAKGMNSNLLRKTYEIGTHKTKEEMKAEQLAQNPTASKGWS